MKAGLFLNSTQLLKDTIFEDTLIFISEYNGQGATGFIVNRKFPRDLNALEEFKHSIPFPLFEGGPVDQEHLFFIHQRPDLIADGTPVEGGIFAGGNFQDAVKHINSGVLTEKDIKIFVGYCGWDYPELDEEIAEGSWEVVEDGKVF